MLIRANTPSFTSRLDNIHALTAAQRDLCTELVKMHKPTIAMFAKKDPELESAAHDALMRVATSDTYDHSAPTAKSFGITAIKRAVLDVQRERNIRNRFLCTEVPLELLATTNPQQDSLLARKNSIEWLNKAINTLGIPEKHLRVLEMLFSGVRDKDVARHFGYNHSTVSNIKSRTEAKLRTFAEQSGNY